MPRVHRTRALMLLASSLLLAPPALADAPARAALAAPATGAPACPSRSFARFLAAFERSARTQRAFTRLPLAMRHRDRNVDKPDGDPVFVEEQLTGAALEFPVFPDAKARAASHRRLKAEETAPGHAEVRVWQEDTDWVVLYRFERDTCWRLVSVDDRSP